MSRFSGGRFATSRPESRIAPADGLLEARDGAQQRGLAAAGRAEDRDELARRDGKVDAMQHRRRAVADVELLDFDRRGVGHLRPALPECVLRGSLRSHLSMRGGVFGPSSQILMLRCEAVRPSLEARTLRGRILRGSFRISDFRDDPRPSTGPLGEPRQAIPLASDQSLLLGAAPALDPALGRDGVGDAIEVLVENEPHGPAGAGVAAERPGLMLVEALVEIVSARRADVVAVVRAMQDIDERAHSGSQSSQNDSKPRT